MKSFRTWMRVSTSAEKTLLARACGVKSSYLYSLAAGDRRISARLADKIERASFRMAGLNPRLPILSRGELCATCRECPHYKSCVKG